ncbi:ABC transporter permease [Halorhodospira abdelmalekii]|uniref:ABC transporter permease n=1 Tax=Halorhodospira abdelmalekii TaxID=421629 RepID=UPI003084542F
MTLGLWPPRALTRKLWRELWTMRSQAVAIAVVIAGGVGTLVMFLTSLYALTETRAAFYQEYRFADLFVSAERAPVGLLAEIAEIPGVQRLADRVEAGATLELPSFDEPITGQLLSLPDGENAVLNRLHVSVGRLPEAGSGREVVVSDGFAEAHELRPGDRLSAVIRGRYQRFEIVGVATSPEHVYQIRPGDLMPDHRRYATVWMNREALAAAYDMEGAFNSLTVALTRDARPGEVIAELDRLLEPWGGRGAHDRDFQTSHRLLEDELTQLRSIAVLIPGIFLGVAAFLLNVVVGRLIATQRETIGILKAFGYSSGAIALHYLQLVLLIVALGIGLGVGLGYVLGEQLALLYAEFFRFPFLDYRLQPRTVAIGAAATTLAALLGTLTAVQRAARLPPAEAMSPEPPPSFRPTLFERLLAYWGVQRWLGQPTRMILRSIERRPGRSLMAIIGIAFAVGILLISPYQRNALDTIVDAQFSLVQRDDVSVTFYEPVSRRALHELAGLPGVQQVEPYRQVAVELIAGHRTHRLAVLGLERDASLRRLLDQEFAEVPLPTAGVLMTDYLAEMLELEVGDTLEVRLLEGRRETVQVPVSGTIAEYIGVSVYMELTALNRLLGEGDAISGAWLAVDAEQRPALLSALERRPLVFGVIESEAALENFRDYLDDTMGAILVLTTALAAVIAFGVIYNNARIGLAERSRELASLRVLGFTRGEVSYILLGEQALLILLALLPGFVVGHYLYAGLVAAVESDLYRVPLLPSPAGMATAALVVLVVAVISGGVVRRRLNRADLVAVLKARE